MEDNAPNLIILNKNFTLSICSKSWQNIIEGLTQINLKLIDETNSWTKYTLNITFESIIIPFFDIIPYMHKNQLRGDGVLLNVTSSNQVDVVDWLNDSTITWLSFLNSRLKIVQDSESYTQTWFKLVSLDSRNRKVFSNTFQLILEISKSPSLTHSLDQFNVPRGVYTLFELPNDLFIDYGGSRLFYNVSITSWSQNHFFDTGIKFSSDNKLILYAYCNFTMACKGSISASNQNQTSEIEIIFNVISWSSKNWIKWFGPYQNQCTEWESEYMLDQSGMWLRKINYFSFDNLTFFKVCSIVSFIFLLVHIILSLFFGRKLINNIKNLQFIIVFMLWINNTDGSINNFLYDILFIKFDFGFLHQFTFQNKMIGCETESKIMQDMQFYCQSTIQNYFFLITIFLAIFIIWVILNIIFKKQNIENFLLKIKEYKLWKINTKVKTDLSKHFIEWFIV